MVAESSIAIGAGLSRTVASAQSSLDVRPVCGRMRFGPAGLTRARTKCDSLRWVC